MATSGRSSFTFSIPTWRELTLERILPAEKAWRDPTGLESSAFGQTRLTWLPSGINGLLPFFRRHDALHLREQGLQRLPDEHIFRKAIAEDRTVLTFDLDFAEIVAFSRLSKNPASAFVAYPSVRELRELPFGWQQPTLNDRTTRNIGLKT